MPVRAVRWPASCGESRGNNLKDRVPPCGVPEMQDFYQPAVFMQPVINAYGGMKNLSNAGSSWDRNTNPRHALEQFDVVKKGRAELLGCARVAGSDVVENDL
jgi:hypothetical protein